jgi:hypothetical protein
MKKHYGTLEGRPVIITDSSIARGYWLIEGKWVLMWPGCVTQTGLRTKEELEKWFPDLPPYPEWQAPLYYPQITPSVGR